MNPKPTWIVCLLSIILITAACAPATSKSEPIIVARPEQPQWPDEVMWVRPDGADGELVAYNMGDGQAIFTLQPGRLSADQQHYFAASLQADTTEVSHFNPANGQLVSNFALDGRWQLKDVSPNGRWLAFAADSQKQVETAWQTEIAVVGVDDGRLIHKLQLDGRFEVDALSNGGTGLFLIQYVPPDQPDNYVVRLYDLAAAELVPDPLRDKRVTDEVMTGYAWGTVADKQGQWWHTLYVSTERNKAFIHALNLHPESRFTLCLDLPSGDGDFAKLQQYSLALSPDSRTIYAANPALGLVAEVSLETLMVRQTSFVAEMVVDGMPTSVMSADGSRLFFTNGRQVWLYDTVAKTVSDPYLADTTAVVQGLGVSDDGARLAVAIAERPLQLFDIASGAALAFPGHEVAERP